MNVPSYTNNGDGTITDEINGLIWHQNMASKMSYSEGHKAVKKVRLGGHSDWRIPSIKELYSLILFTGSVQGQRAKSRLIDTAHFV